MACAQVLMPMAAHKFKGDSMADLDRLVFVCNQARLPTQRPLVERDLCPFDFADAPPLPKVAARSPPKGRSPRASPPKKVKPASPSEASPDIIRTKAAPTHKKAPSSSRGSFDGVQRTSQARFFSMEGSLEDVVNQCRLASRANAAAEVRACPGFFSSPRPCDLPMPTNSLLFKAAATA